MNSYINIGNLICSIFENKDKYSQYIRYANYDEYLKIIEYTFNDYTNNNFIIRMKYDTIKMNDGKYLCGLMIKTDIYNKGCIGESTLSVYEAEQNAENVWCELIKNNDDFLLK